MNKIKKLETIINNNEYFNHYITILMSKEVINNFQDDLDEDIDNTFKRKALSDNMMFPLFYKPMANSDLLKEKLIKIFNKMKRKDKIEKLLMLSAK